MTRPGERWTTRSRQEVDVLFFSSLLPPPPTLLWLLSDGEKLRVLCWL